MWGGVRSPSWRRERSTGDRSQMALYARSQDFILWAVRPIRGTWPCMPFGGQVWRVVLHAPYIQSLEPGGGITSLITPKVSASQTWQWSSRSQREGRDGSRSKGLSSITARSRRHVIFLIFGLFSNRHGLGYVCQNRICLILTTGLLNSYQAVWKWPKLCSKCIALSNLPTVSLLFPICLSSLLPLPTFLKEK